MDITGNTIAREADIEEEGKVGMPTVDQLAADDKSLLDDEALPSRSMVCSIQLRPFDYRLMSGDLLRPPPRRSSVVLLASATEWRNELDLWLTTETTVLRPRHEVSASQCGGGLSTATEQHLGGGGDDPTSASAATPRIQYTE